MPLQTTPAHPRLAALGSAAFVVLWLSGFALLLARVVAAVAVLVRAL